MARHQDDEETELFQKSQRSQNSRNRTATEKGLIGLLIISMLTFLGLIGLLIAILLNNANLPSEPPTPTLNPLDPTLPPQLARKVTKVIQAKIEKENADFLQRFPRDHRYVSQKKLAFFPQPLELTRMSDVPDDEDKVTEIFNSVDENNDGSTDPWELHDWMLYVESHVHKHILDQQWHSLGQAENDNLTWPDYVFKYNPMGLLTHKMKRKLKRDRRRWIHADLDATETLNKTEFKHFLFPKLGIVWVPEFHEDLDNDYDGFVSQKEFESMSESNDKLTTYFKDLDKDRNGLLDIEEISPWVNPASYQAVKTEVIFLMEKLDADDSKSLSLPEILNDTQNFLTSQVTHYGDMYKLKHLREHIFLFDDNDTA